MSKLDCFNKYAKPGCYVKLFLKSSTMEGYVRAVDGDSIILESSDKKTMLVVLDVEDELKTFKVDSYSERAGADLKKELVEVDKELIEQRAKPVKDKGILEAIVKLSNKRKELQLKEVSNNLKKPIG